MFFIDQAINNSDVRGFYNEYLKSDLRQYRQVLESLSDKLKVDKEERQLSGFGFSTTQQNHFICRVTKDSKKIYKVVI